MHLSDSSCAPIFQFFDAALDGATTNRQIPDRIFPQLFTSLRKDNVANYASIWTLFSCDVSVFHNGFIFQMHYTVLIKLFSLLGGATRLANLRSRFCKA